MRGKYFVALGVSLLAIGAAAGFVGTKRAVETKAEGEPIFSVSLKGSFDGWASAVPFNKRSNGDYSLTYYLEKDVQFGIEVKGGGDEFVKYDWSLPAENYDSEYVGNGDGNFKALSAQWFVLTVESDFYTRYKESVTIRKITEPYAISKYAVVNGEVEADPFAIDHVQQGSEYGAPARANRTGYHFGGWFTTTACNVPLAADYTPAASESIYAKYTTLSKDSYVYYITDSAVATTDMIHTFGGDVEYASDDVNIIDVAGVQEVTKGILHFDGAHKYIYKIPYSSESGDTSLMFHANGAEGGWTYKSDIMTLANGSAFKWGWEPSPSQNPEGGYDGVAAGAAITFLVQAEAVRNEAVYSKDEVDYAHSVCGISKSDATTLVGAYGLLSEHARWYVDHSETYTYVDGGASETMRSYADIMTFLAAKAELDPGASILSIQAMKDEQTTSAIVIASLAAVVGIGFITFVVIRRRKIQL